MFDKLIDFLIQFGKDLLPFVIIEQWNGAVHLRFGKYIGVRTPGIHFKLPFCDSIIETPVITQSVNLPAQTLTTLDEQGIVLKAIIRYKVSNVKEYLLGVMHANDVLIDTTQGMIRDIVEVTKWEDLVNVNKIITNEVKRYVKKWGIVVEIITITDLAIVKTFRILGDNNVKPLPLNEIGNG
jgi:regulator of protease activity HflC (stomatin/prohibitin superfamily)